MAGSELTAPLSMAPAPSLVGHLHQMIEDTTRSARDSLLQLDDISNWDANEINHEELLLSLDTIKGQLKEWKQCFINKLRTLWLEQTKEYNDYKRKIESTLKIRHCSELDVAFSNLRDTATDIDLSGCSPYDEETKFKQHLFQLGFKYEEDNKRLQGLCRRQLHETNVFNKLTLAHSERLLHAKQADEKKLQALLQKPLEQLEMLLQAVEKKISASNRAASYTVYRRPKQQTGSAGQKSQMSNAGPGSSQELVSGGGGATPGMGGGGDDGLRTSQSFGRSGAAGQGRGDTAPSSQGRSGSMSQSASNMHQPLSHSESGTAGNDIYASFAPDTDN